MASKKILELENFADTDTVATATTVLQNLITAVKAMYPVGSVLATTTATNPSTYLGGTWTQYASGKMLMGVSSSYPLGSTGGSASHAHMTCLGFDRYSIYARYSNESNEKVPIYGSTVQNDRTLTINHTTLGNTSDGLNRTAYTESVTALPPYVAVYFWQRTA